MSLEESEPEGGESIEDILTRTHLENADLALVFELKGSSLEEPSTKARYTDWILRHQSAYEEDARRATARIIDMHGSDREKQGVGLLAHLRFALLKLLFLHALEEQERCDEAYSDVIILLQSYSTVSGRDLEELKKILNDE